MIGMEEMSQKGPPLILWKVKAGERGEPLDLQNYVAVTLQKSSISTHTFVSCLDYLEGLTNSPQRNI